MTVCEAAHTPPQPAQARSLPGHGGSLDERKRWPQVLSLPGRRGLSRNLRELSNGMRGCASPRETSSRAQALIAVRTLVPFGAATASGSSSRSSVSSRPTFLRMTTRAALPSTASATTVVTPMPSQNHTGTVILSAFTATARPTAACSRTLLV
jgi:hypothetical protein